MSANKNYGVVVTAYEQAELLEVETDTSPLSAREVAGRTLISLISAGTELAGAYQAANFPRYPGYASVFEVEAVGSEVTDIKVGDRAFCMGHHRSNQRKPREEVVLLPPGMLPEVGVFTRMMCVTMSTLTTTSARPPEKVIVTGLGMVGNLAAQIFASCGYDVIGVDTDETRREFALQAGIKRALPAIPLDDPEVFRKVGLVIETSGHEQAVLDGAKAARRRGEVVLVAGQWKRFTEIYLHELLRVIFYEYVDVRSGWEWELPLQPTDYRVNSVFGNLAGGLKWLDEGRIRVDGLYTKVAPRECQQAYQDLLHKRAPRLGIALDWGDCP